MWVNVKFQQPRRKSEFTIYKLKSTHTYSIKLIIKRRVHVNDYKDNNNERKHVFMR